MFANSPTYKNNYESCALEIRNDGIAYARIYRPQQNDERAILKECGFYRVGNMPEQLADSLSLIANNHNNKDAICNWVLYTKHYRLLLTNAPNVPLDEYKDALRWQIKDMIDYPSDDIALDTFAPTSFSQTDPPKLYVIVAQSSFLQKIVKLIKLAPFDLKTIDIKEFAIRNLIMEQSNLAQPVGFLHLDNTECLMTIVKDNQLYFVRHIPITPDIAQEPLGQDFTKISDEIQKSLDYYATELKQEMPTEFLLSPTIEPNSSFVTTLKQNISLSFAPLLLENIIQIDSEKSFSTDLLKTCYVAIGGALRQNKR